MKDYRIFFKDQLPLDKGTWEPEYDLFISSFNLSDRVEDVFSKVNAKDKHWIILPDYNISAVEFPEGQYYVSPLEQTSVYNESDVINDFYYKYLSKIESINIESKICIDITGFIKPYMMYLIALLKTLGYQCIDFIFSEPNYYSAKQKTKFSDESVYEVRQIYGFEGCHNPDTTNDILIIGSGYDDQLIKYISENKNMTKKIQIFGFPSLRADMYQENILRASKASDSIGRHCGNNPNNYLAAANDPFATAQVLKEICEIENNTERVSNIYISPLATKVQALGFTLFYLFEKDNYPISIIYPFCKTHSKRTSAGISRIWRYSIDFD